MILISYKDKNITFHAIAVDSDNDFCTARLQQRTPKKTYLLIDKPGVE